ncbi:DinB family protein [bacterium]|nr:DinB family protein [bacterium]
MENQKLVLEGLEKIREARKQTKNKIANFSEQDFRFKKDENFWCFAEVLHHLTLVDEFTSAYILHFRNKVPKSRLVENSNPLTKITVSEQKWGKVTVPLKEVVPAKFIEKELVLELMENARPRLEKHLLEFDDIFASAFELTHPLMKKLNLLQWCDFLAEHERHHFKQILEIEKFKKL